MRAVLVGGLGFLGAALSERLIEDGWRVTVAAKTSSVAKRPRLTSYLEAIGVRVEAEPSVTAGLLERLAGDVYYHLAGAISGEQRMWEAHKRLAGVAAQAAGELGSRVVYVSSIRTPGRILGAGRGSRVVEEERLLDPELVSPETPYERSKAEGERIVASHRGPWAIVRPGLLVGRWGYHEEWRWVARLSRVRLAPQLLGVPLSPVAGVASLLELAGEGRYDGLWVNAIACTCDLLEVTQEACSLLSGGGCRGLPLGPVLRAVGPLSPPGSPAREAWVMYRRGYTYASRHPQPPWPSPGDAAREWVEWLRWWGSLSL